MQETLLVPLPKMTLFRKSMIFMTFFGCCLALALEAAALATKYWVVANARRQFTNGSLDYSSEGQVNFGLFSGKKQLNFGYGTRYFTMNVTGLLLQERDFMIYGLWLGTVICLAGAILFSALGAIFAVVNTATNPVESAFGVSGLYVWNSIAVILNLATMGTWIGQFYFRLKGNVFDKEERAKQWTSANMATFGYSFWLLLGSVLVHFLNLMFLISGTRERKPKNEFVAPIEGKGQGAIMLY